VVALVPDGALELSRCSAELRGIASNCQVLTSSTQSWIFATADAKR